jgi:hypothetical protein
MDNIRSKDTGLQTVKENWRSEEVELISAGLSVYLETDILEGQIR